MSIYDNRTLEEILTDPRIAPIAKDAVRNRDFSQEEIWHKTPAQIEKDRTMTGRFVNGFDRLFAAAESGEWYYPLFEEEPERANLVWFPSEDPEADGRPYLLVVPGGGFVNVWNMTEGWPIADQFNRLGHHAFILTYQVTGERNLLQRNMEEMAAAIRFIRQNEGKFHVRGDRYISCGFSAGGYLVCLWNTEKGYPAFGLPKPQAVFPIYPVTSLREDIRYGETNPEWAIRLYGCPLREAAKGAYEVPEHVEGFPPTALFLAADDDLVNPENSRILARALEARHIPCRLEIGPSGNHGFADGTGTCMEGWTARAVEWYRSLT